MQLNGGILFGQVRTGMVNSPSQYQDHVKTKRKATTASYVNFILMYRALGL